MSESCSSGSNSRAKNHKSEFILLYKWVSEGVWGRSESPQKQELDICCSSRLFAGGLRRLALPRGKGKPSLTGLSLCQNSPQDCFRANSLLFGCSRRAVCSLFLREKGGRKNLLLRTYHFNKVKARSSTKVAVITSLCATDKRTAAAVNSDL